MNKLVFASLPLATLATLQSEAKSPNVVIIMTDQQRADISKREGFALDATPYADQLARENVWFNRAYTSMPASSPARVSMFTGRFPSATNVRSNHNISDASFEVDLVDVLKTKGYATAMIGKNHAHFAPADFDFWAPYGHWGKLGKLNPEERKVAKFLRDKARGQWLDPSLIPLKEQLPTKIVDQAINWIEKQGDEPFFAWISFPEPHNPYQVCEPYYSMFAPESVPECVTTRKDLAAKGESYKALAAIEDLSCPNLQNDLPRLRANYVGMVRLIDDQIRRFIESVKDSGKYEDTIFVILSDHGDYCGEYGLIRKGAGVSDLLTRIPFIWAGYGIKQQATVSDAHVSITDVMPTICDAVDIDIPNGVQGRSLWDLLTGNEYPKEEFSSIVVEQGYSGECVTLDDELSFEEEGALTPGKVGHFDELNSWTQSGTTRMVREGDWKLIMNQEGRGELYNLKRDPYEVNNLYNKRRYADKVAQLTKLLLVWQLNLQDPLPHPQRRYIYKRDEKNYRTVSVNE